MNIFYFSSRGYILTPNIYFHQTFGKLLFAFTDLAIGEIIRRILLIYFKEKKGEHILEKNILLYVSIWLLNPISINVSTRGKLFH